MGYPSGVSSFTTLNNGDTSDVSQIDPLYTEIVAIETALLNGFQHNISPLNDNSKDLGDSTHAWKDLYLKGNLKAAGQNVVFDNRVNDFRLTLTTGVPVTTADVTGATTIYCSPYAGNRIALYDGAAQWNVRTSAEFSIALGTLTNDLPYDVFCYDNAGVPTLEILAWTSKTARATALVLQDGVLVKSGATTRRWLGTFHTTATTTTEDSAAKRLLSNYYNRVPRPFLVKDTTASWTYVNPNSVWRQARASTANQAAVVIGWSEVEIDLRIQGLYDSASSGPQAGVSIGEDSTTTPATEALSSFCQGPSTNDLLLPITCSIRKMPAVGYHFYAWLEAGVGGAATYTFYGYNAAAIYEKCGMNGSILG